MAANGVKKEEDFIVNVNDPKPVLLLDDHHHHGINDNHAPGNDHNINGKKKGVSIAERRAAKCGFNGSNTIDTSRPGPFFTIPSGISPSALLDSPVMLPNAQAQLSPTTGTFQFPSSPNHESLKLKLKLASNGDTSAAMGAQANTFGLENKPYEGLEYPRDLQEMSNTVANVDHQVLGNNKPSEADHQPSFITTTNLQQQQQQQQQPPNAARNQQIVTNNNNNNNNIEKERNTNNQKGSYFPKEVAKYSEDGFYWRKYGQKHVKGSEYPRSYYKCTNANCPVKKIVERSHDGQIAEIVYKGSHNHPEPQPVRRFGEGSDQIVGGDGGGACLKNEGGGRLDVDWRGNDHGLDNGLACSTSFMSVDPLNDPASRTMKAFESVDQTVHEFSSAFGSRDCDDNTNKNNNNNNNNNNNIQNEASPESTSFNDEDDENGECEPKKRKRESFPSETAIPRSTREPRVVVQIESDIDILDDGYRWRKYGQKVVKGNPNPRSYYKCTTPGCPVRKHVERAADDIKSVITTYEGKHNHEVPSSKTGNIVISDVANLPSAVTNTTLNTIPLGQKHDHHASKAGKQVQDNLPLYLERKPMLNYNELMRSNLPGNFPSDLSFGTSSMYPISFPPFHSLPYGSLLMNGSSNHIKSTSYNPSSSIYPMLPDYMPLQSQINPGGSSNVGNYNFNSYGTSAAAAAAVQGQEKTIVKPKEEQRDEGELYDTCLSIPNHGNGTI